jgi:DNA processing protein
MVSKTDIPGLLKTIPSAPKQLYHKGQWDESIFENCLAVVGSRQMTSYGKRIAGQLVSEIAAAGVTIVSGFMYGIDATAHRAAVRAGGRTIAVMPCGIELIHPEHQKDLYEEIIESGGLILSEWEGDMQPFLWTYPMRNRIVAGLSKATLVVEASEGSGSLITAGLAKKFGRKLFAVPGPVTSQVSAGTSQLIKEGAGLVTTAQDVLDFFAIKSQLSRDKSQTSNPTEQKILDVLKREALDIDSLARLIHMPASELGTTLSLLELQGIISQDGGKYYAN